ncbi:MAG TPA: hypothetical protein PLZ51_18090 [Aggregatilineales bacterium]|nr:hypothetical protein [Aggregatilineales bacterium]
MSKKNIFLSSPNPQSDALADFRAALIKQGLKVFNNDGISPDSNLARSEIAMADCVVVGLVNADEQSDRFHKEINTALEEKKRIIVAQLEGNDIPQRLSEYAVIDLRNHFDACVQLVVIAIAGKTSAMPMASSSPSTPLSSPAQPKTTPTVPNMIPRRIDNPLTSSKPLMTSSTNPISQEAANPATVIAVMFAIVLIGFVVLTNLPTGNASRGVSNVTERAISSSLVEFSTPNIRIVLPNTWQDNTSSATSSPELQQALGIGGMGRSAVQMGLSDRETNNAFLVLMLPLNNQPVTLRELKAAIDDAPPQTGAVVSESLLRSYGFGDALYLEVNLEGRNAYNYMVMTFSDNYLYMILMVSETESASLFEDLLRRFDIVSDATPVW